jgi:hypothetical protein
MRDTWNKALAKKNAVHVPNGTFDSFRVRALLLVEKHLWYMKRLEADLASPTSKLGAQGGDSSFDPRGFIG